MSDINQARRTAIEIEINNVDMTEDFNERLVQMTWDDAEDGEADNLSIVLVDRDNVVVDEWLATELENRADANLNGGTKITFKPVITQENWEGGKGKDISLAIGAFVLDDVQVTASSSGQQVSMEASSADFETSIRDTTYTRAWENMTLLEIATDIAEEAGYTILYLVDGSVTYSRKEQSGETNASFLQRLCTAAGLSMKITDGSIVIFSQNEYENKTSSRTIERGDGTYSEYTLQATLSDTCYSACTVTYDDTTSGEEIEYTYTPDGYTYDEDNVLTVSDEKVSSTAEAKELAISSLREANKGQFTASFTMPGDISLVAGLTVTLSGFGGFDGEYYIESSSHTISSSGYETTIELRMAITEY